MHSPRGTAPVIESFKSPPRRAVSKTPCVPRGKQARLDIVLREKADRAKSEVLLFDEEGVTTSNAATAVEDVEVTSKGDVADKKDTKGKQLSMLKSVFNGRTATVFFPYPKQCMLTRNSERCFPIMAGEFKLKYKITDSVCVYNCIKSALRAAGFAETEGSSWNVLWSSPLQPETLRNFSKYQRCNHFPGTWQLGRKDNLWRNMSRMRRKYGANYDICPQTYILPEDYERLQTDKESDAKALWIMKPVASCCGRGIRLIPRGGRVPKKQYH